MTARVRRDSRRALTLFGAAVLTLVVVLFSMPPAMARVAQSGMNPLGASVPETTTRGPIAAPNAETAPSGQQNSSAAGFAIRLAADTRERSRELFDPHDSALDETRYYPGRGYDVPWDRDPLFGQTRHSVTSFVSAVPVSPAETRSARRKASVKQRNIRLPNRGFGTAL